MHRSRLLLTLLLLSPPVGDSYARECHALFNGELTNRRAVLTDITPKLQAHHDTEAQRNRFHTKFSVRRLGIGGPIAQPAFFWGIRPNETIRARLIRQYGRFNVEDHSPGAFEEIPAHLLLSIDQLISQIRLEKISLPLVFKPNLNAHGKGIFFIERGADDQIIITLVYKPADGPGFRFEPTHKAIEHLKRMGVGEFHYPDGQDIVKITLDSGHSLFTAAMKRIWESTTSEETMVRTARYDSGMVEEKLSFLTYQGNSYETRNRYKVTAQGTSVTNMDLQEGSQARVGSSAYFSNATARKKSVVLPVDQMYAPLFSVCKIPVGEQEAFKTDLNRLIRSQIEHYLERLKSDGVKVSNELWVTLDLKWVQNDPNELPTPVIIEAALTL